jgi:hypothetical protein
MSFILNERAEIDRLRDSWTEDVARPRWGRDRLTELRTGASSDRLGNAVDAALLERPELAGPW